MRKTRQIYGLISCLVLMLILTACGGTRKMSVSLSGEVEANKGFPEVSIQTDLPDETVVKVAMYCRGSISDAPSEYTQVVVKDGQATITLDNNGIGFPNEDYNVRLTVEPKDQPDDLKEKMGELGENLDGSNVATTDYESPNYQYVYTNIPVDIEDSDVVIEQAYTQEQEPETSTDTAQSEDKVIESYIRSHVKDTYTNTDIDSITINDDLGTDVEGDYVALVNLTWNVKNSAKTSEEMLQMYSDDLAASLAKDQPNVQEVAIFWKVPYLGENTSKWSYERKGEGMYSTDKMLGF